jgi:hypothetical protein
MRTVLSLPCPLGLAIAIAMIASPAHADPTHTRGVTCIGGGLRAPPEFSQISPGRAEYHFSGVCTTRTGRSVGYRIDATWTPSESNPGNANASEIYHVDFVSGPSMPGVAVVGWRCARDPWLNDADCVRIGATVPEQPSEFWEEFGAKSLPVSRLSIPRDQRAALRDQYARVNGQAVRPSLVARPITATSGIGIEPPKTRTEDRVSASIDETALNPQPLPPEPPPERTATTPATPVVPTHQETGIIIVGGKNPAPRPIKPAVRASARPAPPIRHE